MNTNKYPIYVISKGRWSRRQTVRTLLSMDIQFSVVVEPSEYSKYAEVIDEKYLLKAPENFSERGQGSIPVRNFVWEHSIEAGHKRHWILDDNIEAVERFNRNKKIKCRSAKPFAICEEFVDRYKNIGLAGLNYTINCPTYDARPPFQINTRIYSCILIDNSIPFRWRGRYNEDTDLSIRVMKHGSNTILFNAFLIDKRTTLVQGGGNADIYADSDNRRLFAESLRDQHPDLVDVVWRYDRWHHQVNYKPFKHRMLEYVDGYTVRTGINEFGMELRDVTTGELVELPTVEPSDDAQVRVKRSGNSNVINRFFK